LSNQEQNKTQTTVTSTTCRPSCWFFMLNPVPRFLSPHGQPWEAKNGRGSSERFLFLSARVCSAAIRNLTVLLWYVTRSVLADQAPVASGFLHRHCSFSAFAPAHDAPGRSSLCVALVVISYPTPTAPADVPAMGGLAAATLVLDHAAKWSAL
jgi:hypothetical protein